MAAKGTKKNVKAKTAKSKPVKKAAPKKPAAKLAAKPAKPAAGKPVPAKPEPMPFLPVKTYSADELKRFKELILSKRKETVEELDNLKESMMDVSTGEYVSESSTYSLHMEQGTDAMEREKTFLFASRGGKFVNQLDDALARIEAKTYGVCRVCGLLVPKDRLAAVPTATTCVEYKNTGIACERGRVVLAKRKPGK